MTSRGPWPLLLFALAALVAGCWAVTTPAPSGATNTSAQTSPNPNLWTEAIADTPAEATATAGPGSSCKECHVDVNTSMRGIAAGPAGLVAVGWIFQDFSGVAWHSTDGVRWTADQPLRASTSLQAVAADGSRYVAAGLDGQGATAWSSTDGVDWQRTASADAFAGTPLRVTAAAHWSGGFEIAGYQGLSTGSADAAFWFSVDGLRWQRAPDSPGLDGARALSLSAGGPGLVAVGTTGPADGPGGAVVWTSADGLNWSLVPAGAAFDGASTRTVADIPGIGLVAAGETLSGDAGAAWTSADGSTWTRAPNEPDPGGPNAQIRINALAAGGPGVVALGVVAEGQEAQYGSSAVWTSADGRAWQRRPSGAEFVASEINAVVAWHGGLVAVGYSGAPDDLGATVWRSPESLNH
jgi:hypothetical protein